MPRLSGSEPVGNITCSAAPASATLSLYHLDENGPRSQPTDGVIAW
jgi:hypothetical protein